MEFSPDGNRIFILQGGSSSFPNLIYSCPVSASNFTVTSAHQLSGLTLSNSLTMEMAADGKLYINPSQNANFLYYVSNPNSATPTVSSTATNLFGANQRVGAGFPDQVDGDAGTDCLGIGIASYDLIKNISVYPNPSKGISTIKLTDIHSLTHLKVYNV